jgi:alginate O-acetyltransferase complex protein AlgI
MCLFLPIFLIIYFALPRLRNLALIAASLAFYAFGEPLWIIALIFSGTVSYIGGRVIEQCAVAGRKSQARAALVVSLALNLGLLVAFKYSAFLVETVNAVGGLSLAVPKLALPLGISFFTFQTLSYTLDVARGTVKAQRSAVKFFTYVTMFPQLLAGPIVRYADIETALTERSVTAQNLSDGITRFVTGLAKKVLLANAAGSAVTALLAPNLRQTVLGNWLGIIFYSFQLYFDFSGYSDMALGLAKMLGFDFKENFNYPYIAQSITDFWRRWHISLSSFFRDYVYIPLGGNRRHQLVNLLVVWLLTGLWHGASWNFILWGAYYGAVLILEKFVLKRVLDRVPRAVRHVYSLAVIIIGWAIFYFTDFAQLAAFFKVAFGGAPLSDFRAISTLTANLFLLIALIVAATPLPKLAAQKLRSHAAILEPLRNTALLLVCFAMLVGQSYSPFLYFRF